MLDRYASENKVSLYSQLKKIQVVEIRYNLLKLEKKKSYLNWWEGQVAWFGENVKDIREKWSKRENVGEIEYISDEGFL